MRIVLDTNCLLQAVPPRSRHHIVLSALQQGRYDLCCSTDILLEYEELLSQFYPPHLTENTMGFIVHSPHTIMVTPHFKWRLITADPDDDKFVDCALNSGASCIVTNDRHFDVLKHLGFPPINVFDLQTFCGMIAG